MSLEVFNIGLDNGIILKKNSTVLPFWLKRQFEYEPSENLEICYWRKCWGVRNAILAMDFENEQEILPNDGVYYLTAKDIHTIRTILRYFSHRKIWEDESNSIWSWEDFRQTLRKQRRALWWLEGYLKRNPEVVCYFYDSY